MSVTGLAAFDHTVHVTNLWLKEFVLPPLGARHPVIRTLCRRFLAEFVRRNRPDIRAISAGALWHLEAYAWPGNLRELRNTLERMVALSPGPILRSADLPPALQGWSSLPAAAAGSEAMPLSDVKAQAEIRQIQQALAKHGNNRLRAAAELGISRNGLYKKLQKYRLA